MKKIKFYLLASMFFLFSFQAIHAQCLITDVVAEAQPCDADGMFFVDLDFNNVGGQSDSVIITGNGTNYGTFWIDVNATEFTFTLGPFVGDGTTDLEFIVTDQDIVVCTAFTELDAINCNPTACQITDLIVEAHPCNADGMFLVDLDFNYENMPSDSFFVVGNGTNYGTFAYGDLFVTLGPILGDGTIDFEFIVIDSEDSDCTHFIGLDAIDCSGDCEIGAMEVDILNCNPNGTYQVIVNFDYENVSNDFFDVFVNGAFFDYYLFADLPITIDSFPTSGNANDVIQICQNDLPSCCNILEFEAPNCGGNCLTFNNLTSSTIYGAPQYEADDLIFTEDGVPFKIQEYVSGTTSSFNSVIVLDNNLAIYNFPTFDGNFLYPFKSNIELNLLQLPGPVVHIEFDFWNDGAGINIGANDATLIQANSLFDIDGMEIAPGVTITIVPDATVNQMGKAIIDGFVGLLTIGSNEDLLIDNICMDYAFLGDCWAGDTDANNIVSNFDLLNIGLAYGATGTARQDASIAWLAQASDDWMEVFESGVNFKHADANGDGEINASDKFAIDENYGLTHGIVAPYTTPTATTTDPNLFIIMPNPSDVGVGVFEAEIHLGNADFPVDDIYGLAFTIEYGNQVFDASSMEIIFEDGWMNSNGADDLLSMQHQADGKISAALTRINHVGISGNGKIGTVHGIIDDLTGYAAIELGITNVKGLKTNEAAIPIYTPQNYVEITTATRQPFASEILIFPNPASEVVFIKNNNKSVIQNIRLINMLGQEVIQKTISDSSNIELNISKLPEGTYFVEIQMEGSTMSRKIEITR